MKSFLGTWTPANRFDGWVRVLAHIPDHGAHTQQAKYEIETGTGTRVRYLPTRRQRHAWVALGTYEFSDSGSQQIALSNITEDGRGVEDIAWDAIAFQPLPAKPQHFVVAIGDSYISGDGAGDYHDETDTNYGDYGWNACRRSENSWPRKLVLPSTTSPLGQRTDSYDPTLDFHSVACSGATAVGAADTATPDHWTNPPADYEAFVDDAEGQYGEISQIESGVLSSDTTMVVLSVGGNDAGFGNVMAECAETGCASAQREMEIRQDIAQVQDEIRHLIDAIHLEAENATIVLTGYPMLFSEDIYQDPLHPTSSCAVLYSADEAMMLNSLAHDMRDYQKITVASAVSDGLDVQFVNMVDRFGNFGACPTPGTGEDIHAIVQAPTGDGDFRWLSGASGDACVGFDLLNYCVSRQSFHPKQTGTTRYAVAVADRLDCGEFCVGWTGPRPR